MGPWVHEPIVRQEGMSFIHRRVAQVWETAVPASRGRGRGSPVGARRSIAPVSLIVPRGTAVLADFFAARARSHHDPGPVWYRNSSPLYSAGRSRVVFSPIDRPH